MRRSDSGGMSGGAATSSGRERPRLLNADTVAVAALKTSATARPARVTNAAAAVVLPPVAQSPPPLIAHLAAIVYERLERRSCTVSVSEEAYWLEDVVATSTTRPATCLIA